jgi:hypothetical protein
MRTPADSDVERRERRHSGLPGLVIAAALLALKYFRTEHDLPDRGCFPACRSAAARASRIIATGLSPNPATRDSAPWTGNWLMVREPTPRPAGRALHRCRTGDVSPRADQEQLVLLAAPVDDAGLAPYRPGRNAQQAGVEVNRLVVRGHPRRCRPRGLRLELEVWGPPPGSTMRG